MSLPRIVAIGLMIINVKGICPPNITEGTYGLWSHWSDCSVKCGDGKSWRSKGLCCPNKNGTLVDCRTKYNLTEVILYELSNCTQTCLNGTSASRRCDCISDHMDSCCSTEITTTTNETASSVKDTCTDRSCSILMTCKNLHEGGYYCDCVKVGNTNLCLYVLIIILGCLAVAGVVTCLMILLIGRKNRKVEGTRMAISEY